MPSSFNGIKSVWRLYSNAHPLVKGMISYSIIWPSANVMHQTMEGKNFKTYDWIRVMRFCFFGSCYVAPTLYCWIRLSSAMWPTTSLRSGITKALVEQLSYSPFACSSFFFFMSLLELKTLKEAAHEVKKKFWPTYQFGLCIWPFLQTINFSMIPERNRLVFVSFCSLLWSTFLAYMQSKDIAARRTRRKKGKKTVGDTELKN